MILRYGGSGAGAGAGSAICLVMVAMKALQSAASAADRAVLGAVTPDTLGMGEEVRIRWSYDDGNGGSLGKFDIGLYDCGDAFCGQDDCGAFVAGICDHPFDGCGDGLGDYWMTVPEDLTAGDSYKIRVGLHGTELFDCTSTFEIVDRIPVPSMEVFSPRVVDGAESIEITYEEDDDDASSVVESFSQRRFRHLSTSSSSSEPQLDGEMEGYAATNDTLLVSWAYDDGFEGSFARFNVDLYYCGGACSRAGNCGEMVARLCEACPDSSGSELVTVPDVYSSHNYKIRVSTWSGVRRPASSCSPKFEIRARDRPYYSTPSPTAVPEVDSPSLYPRPPSMEIPSEDLAVEPVIRPSVFPEWGEKYVPPVQVACNDSDVPDVRYAGTTKRIYVERNGTRGGCFTLTQIWESGKRPLYPVDPFNNSRVTTPTGVWLLTEELYVLDGVTLQLHGTARGGDCDELRLLSDENTILNLRAHGGSLSLLGTKVVSWDEGKGTVDTNHEDGRSYISAVSELIYDPSQLCNGTAKENRGETRMDVIDSEVGYLGYHASESYGLVWKVRGFCIDKSNEEVFAQVNVYGDMINSNIHHNYFGHYSYGHQGGNWSYNKMHDNVEYGFDPHDDSDYLTIVGNDVWGNGNHGIIASKRCDHVTISNNHVSFGVNTGLFLHRSSDYAIVTGNHVHNNGDAGLAVLESFYMDVHDNVFKDNRYGIRFSVGAGYNWINNNVINRSFRYNIFTYLGSDLPDVPGTTGFPVGNVFWRNYISGTYLDTIKLKEADLTVVANNRISSAATIMFDQCTDTTYRDNTQEDYLSFSVRTDSCFSGDSDSDLSPTC